MLPVNRKILPLGLYHLQEIDNPMRVLGLEHNEYHMNQAKSDELKELLMSAIQQIQGGQYSDLNFEELYRAGYYLVLHKHGANLYSGLQKTIADHINVNVLPTIMDNRSNNFLNIINSAWDTHQKCISIIGDMLMYMDRVYAQVNRLDDVCTLGINLFRNLVVYQNDIHTNLQVTLTDMVTKERQGEVIDREAFTSATKMLMVLGNKTPNVYQDIFEQAFIHESTMFFNLESKLILQNMDASLYLRRVDMRIFEEIERSVCCLDETTRPKIIKVVEDELITAHMGVVIEMKNSGLVHMMQNQMTEDLACMYRVLGRVPNGPKMMFDSISCYLRQQGQILVRDDDTNNDAIIYVQNLLDLKDKIDFYLAHSFSSDKLCQQMIASDFTYILNLNAKSSEYLSLFIDEKLKKCRVIMTDDDQIVLFNKTMVLFRFLQDKDMFEQYYKQHLAKRLLNRLVNEDNERRVIKLFQNECGLQYTRRMEGMFRDIWTSSSLTEAYRKHIADNNERAAVDLRVRVLTSVYWPNSDRPEHDCHLPSAPSAAFQTFEKFYLSRHCGRQLTLLPQLGSAEIEAYFETPQQTTAGWTTPPTGNGRTCRLLVSTYQMCVLMLFNEKPQWTFEEMTLRVTMSEKELRRAVHALVMSTPSHILERSEDHFFVNESYEPKTNKVKPPAYQIKNETELERQIIRKRVNEDRNQEIEAAMIRIMKLNKVMTQDNLVNEIIRVLRPRFVPSKDVVKTRIEVLIERKYLERSTEDRRTYRYVPA